MDIFDKVGKKKKEDKIKKKKTKKDKSSKKAEETATNGTTANPVEDEWADEAGVEEIEIVQTKLKTNLQMTNLADDKENTNEDDGNKDDWANKDQKKENDSEDDSTEKTENNNSTENATKPADDDQPKKPAGKFVPKHLRGGNDSSSRPTLPNSSLINQGLRGPGGRRMFHKEPPKTESHSEFPTLGMAMKEMSTKTPEGFEKVHSDTRGGYRGGNDSAGNQNLSTSNKFGAFGS